VYALSHLSAVESDEYQLIDTQQLGVFSLLVYSNLRSISQWTDPVVPSPCYIYPLLYHLLAAFFLFYTIANKMGRLSPIPESQEEEEFAQR